MTEEERATRVLIVEDESLAAMALEEILATLNCEVCGIEDNADDAVAAVGRENPDLVMMDIRLRGTTDGIEAACNIRRLYGVRCIFMSAFADPETRRRAEDCEPYAFVKKPYFPDQLERALASARQQLAAPG